LVAQCATRFVAVGLPRKKLTRSFPPDALAVVGRRRTPVWFRADLRLHDHELFHAAAGASSSSSSTRGTTSSRDMRDK
jgi:hypothetical protein